MCVIDKSLYLQMYKEMKRVRKFDEKFIELADRKEQLEPAQCQIGQEAVGIGSVEALCEKDYVVPHLRTRQVLLARGAEPKEQFAAIMGKENKITHGRGTTHHMGDNDLGIIGTSQSVGSQLPVASGVALACNFNANNQVVLAYVGDGGTNEGAFHEAVNWAAVQSLPVIFIIENNLYALSTSSDKYLRNKDLSERASGYGIPGTIVDGQDVIEVYEETKKAIERARNGNGPTMIECKTYRFCSHGESLPDNRDKEEVDDWKKKDPIVQFEQKLLSKEFSTKEDLKEIDKKVEREINAAVDYAEQSPFPEPTLEDLYKDTYSNSKGVPK